MSVKSIFELRFTDATREEGLRGSVKNLGVTPRAGLLAG